MIPMVVGVDPTNVVDLIKQTGERQIELMDMIRKKCYTYSYLYEKTWKVTANQDRYDHDVPILRFENPLNRTAYILEMDVLFDNVLKTSGDILINNDGTAVFETTPGSLERADFITVDALRGLRFEANKYLDLHLKTSPAAETTAYVSIKIGVYE